MRRLNVYIVGSSRNYADFLTCEFQIVEDITISDIVIFTGGEDVNPMYYEEFVGKRTLFNPTRDDLEYGIFQIAVQFKKLIIGICRGSQFLTVMSGGRLIQHVSNHTNGYHDINIIDENRNINITSTHHQMMYPFNMNKNDFKIIAKSSKKISNTFLNGHNNEIMLSSDFVECEIVYYNKTNCLCIQGHPEYMDKNSDAVSFINVLVEELLEDVLKLTVEEKRQQDMVNDNLNRQMRPRVMRAFIPGNNPEQLAGGRPNFEERMGQLINDQGIVVQDWFSLGNEGNIVG